MGAFILHQQLRKRWLRQQVSTTDVESELQAQYQRFHEAAGEPDFWNSHQNFHVWPGLFQICVALGQRLRIPIMRSHHRYTIPRDRTASSYSSQSSCFLVKKPSHQPVGKVRAKSRHVDARRPGLHARLQRGTSFLRGSSDAFALGFYQGCR